MRPWRKPARMPFTPLPKTFLDDLARWRRGRVVELGCGDGLLTEQLRDRGVDPITIDRMSPTAGTIAAVVGDAIELPLCREQIDLVVAGNLLRQMWPLPEGAPVPDGWRDALAPAGCLYVFEDEPLSEPPAARHYRDLQVFLARLLPETRRPLLPLATFRRACAGSPGAAGWSFGLVDNGWPVDRQDVLVWLARPDLCAGQEAARLVAAIAADGCSYGRFWWARWSGEDLPR